MSLVAEHALDEKRRPLARSFHLLVVVVFEGEHVHAGERLDQFLGPAPQIGRVPDRPRRAIAGIILKIEAEAEIELASQPEAENDLQDEPLDQLTDGRVPIPIS